MGEMVATMPPKPKGVPPDGYGTPLRINIGCVWAEGNRASVIGMTVL